MKVVFLAGLFCLGTVSAVAAEAPVPTGTENGKVRYRQGKDIDFSETVIQGQNRRPEASVVTGNVQQGGDALIRLREHFVDRIAVDYAEDSE